MVEQQTLQDAEQVRVRARAVRAEAHQEAQDVQRHLKVRLLRLWRKGLLLCFELRFFIIVVFEILVFYYYAIILLF